MRTSDKEEPEFKVTDEFKKRALELLDESQAVQFVEGLRLNSAAAVVFGREEKRLRQKYGDDDLRVKEMTARLDASREAKADLYSRYADAMTPQATPEKGWTVDGFVRTAEGVPAGGVMVAAYDRSGNIYKDLGKATTEKNGYFLIEVKDLPDKPASAYMRASLRGKILESNDVLVAPAAGSSDRVEIILIDRTRDTPDPRQGYDQTTQQPTNVETGPRPKTDATTATTPETAPKSSADTTPKSSAETAASKSSADTAAKPYVDTAPRVSADTTMKPKPAIVTAKKPVARAKKAPVKTPKSEAGKKSPAKKKTGSKTKKGKSRK
jgi:hypothetical protein